MAKGYWIAHVDVTDPAKYENYRALVPAAIGEFGGAFVVRGGASTPVEGAVPGARHVAIEFPSYQAALDCYRSPTYSRAKAEREAAGVANILVVEGV